MNDIPAVVPATQVKIGGATAAQDHPSHWQAILAAIMAGLNAATPLIVTLVPPKAAVSLQLGEALEPTVVSVVQAVQAAGQQ